MKKINLKLTKTWYLINGKFVHFDGWNLNGKRLSIKELYKFELENFNLIYK